METVYISKKKSGNYTVTNYSRQEWELIATCESPFELYNAIRKLPAFSRIIKAEYSRSQSCTLSTLYSEKDALKAFGLSASAHNINEHFTKVNIQ